MSSEARSYQRQNPLAYFKMAVFFLPQLETQGDFLYDLHCENLVEIQEVKFTEALCWRLVGEVLCLELTHFSTLHLNNLSITVQIFLFLVLVPWRFLLRSVVIFDIHLSL